VKIIHIIQNLYYFSLISRFIVHTARCQEEQNCRVGTGGFTPFLSQNRA